MGTVDKIISFCLFSGLSLYLLFLPFAQDRMFRAISENDLSLGPEKYLRIFAVFLLVVSVVFHL